MQTTVRSAQRPVILPTGAIDDNSLFFGSNNTSRYIDMGMISIPAGDWCIAIPGVRITGQFGIMPVFSIGDRSDTICSANGNLQLVYVTHNNAAQTSDPYRGCWMFSARDDAGNWISDAKARGKRSASPYMGTAARVLQGPAIGTDNERGYDEPRGVFVVKSGNEISLWVVDQGCVARKHAVCVGSFGSISDKPCRMGMMNRVATKAYYAQGGLHVQRPFLVGQALTGRQMEAIAAGVDPRLVTTFGPNDRLWAFRGTAERQPDLVAGQVATLVGAGYAAGTQIIPTAVQDIPRVVMSHDQVYQRNGIAVSDWAFEGTVTGPDDDIYMRLQTFAASPVQVVDWIKVGRSSGGVWSGIVPGIPSNVLEWREAQIRKGLSGTPISIRKRIGLGIVVNRDGQSLQEGLRIFGTRTITGAAAGFVSLYSRAKSDSGAGQEFHRQGWYRTNSTGIGESIIAEAIASQANCPVGLGCSAVSGTGIDAYLSDTNSIWIDSVLTIRDMKPGYQNWEQGQGSLLGQAYKPKMDSLYARQRAVLPADCKYGVMPLNNNERQDMYLTRQAQLQWVVDMAANDERVSLVGSCVDEKLADTVHASQDAGGFARAAERYAQWVLFHEGIAAHSGVGPRIVSATWTVGTPNIRLTLQHNGGSALRTPAAGNISGFTCDQQLTVTSATIVDGTHVDLVLSRTPAAAPRIGYQLGAPGKVPAEKDANGFMVSIANALYDDRSPYFNKTLGYPVMFTDGSIQAMAA